MITTVGWKEIQDRYAAASGLRHDRSQFEYIISRLKDLYGFYKMLRDDTDNGIDENGNITTPDHWWDANTKVLFSSSAFPVKI